MKRITRNKLLIVAALLLITTVTTVFAYKMSNNNNPRKSPEEIAQLQTDKIANNYGLNADQKAQVYDINLKAAQKLRELAVNMKGSDAFELAQTELRKEQIQQISAKLNPEQRVVWDKREMERLNRPRPAKNPS